MKFFIIILFFSSSLFSQKKIDFNNFDYDLLEKLVLKKINQERIKKKRQALVLDSVLGIAAQNQSDYQANKKRMTHNQTSSKMKSALKRVIFAGGGFSLVGENVAYTDVFGSVRLRDGYKTKSFEVDTYETIVKILFIGWKNSKHHYQSIIEKDYTHTGLKFALDIKNKRLYATQVFGKK